MKHSNDLNHATDYLVSLLMSVLKEQEGESFVVLLEKLHKRFANNESADLNLVKNDIDDYDIDTVTNIIRASNLFFHVTNIAEERHKYLQRSQQFEQHLWKSSFNDTVKFLHENEYSAKQVQSLLNKIDFKPVFTAHPTEAKRRTILQVISKIKQAYIDYQNAISDSRRYEAEKRMKALMQILWKTEEVRADKPSVVQEIETSLYFFKTTIFAVIPELYKNLHRALKSYYPDNKFDIPKILSFGSWVGGDRDGNPFVTPDLTRKALRLQQVELLQEYISRVDHLCELFTHNDTFCELSPALKQDLKSSDNLARATYAEKADREHKTEPYRRKLGMMSYRLQQRVLQCEARLRGDDTIKYLYAYQSASEFKRDLTLIHDSLHQHNDADLANGSLRDLMRLVDVFDFYLNKLDIRQESIEHSAVVAELLQVLNVEANYLELAETQKTQLLNELLENSSFEKIEISNLSENAQSILAVFSLVDEMREEIGANCFDSYIISMTRSANHILEVALLAAVVGLNDGHADKSLVISPLFETIEDLENAPEILDQLFSVSYYQQLLRQQKQRQEIMLGYSDSCKDGGIVASSWNLYLAQQAILQVIDKYELDCCLFHGRGGTVARGGGNNVFEAIQSQPTGTVRGSIKFTEQGEVLSNRYHDLDTALHELTMGLSGLMMATVKKEVACDISFTETMNAMVTAGEQHYRLLTDNNKALMQFFYDTTPTKQIGLLNIGSRPSHRKKQDFSKNSIRAIGWVFAWAQCRLNMPGWYGLGTALAAQDESTLREMYQEFPFFKTMLDKTEMVLAKTDMPIAKAYANLCDDKKIADEIFGKIETEYRLTLEQVNKITQQGLLAKQDNLRQSIHVRQAYLAPLNHIQVTLLERVGVDLESEWVQPLLRSINALSVGLRNTG